MMNTLVSAKDLRKNYGSPQPLGGAFFTLVVAPPPSAPRKPNPPPPGIAKKPPPPAAGEPYFLRRSLAETSVFIVL